MQLADYTFEDRLIERIALKELLREQLKPQARRAMCLRLEGYTYREVGERLGVCGNRARQIEERAFHRLLNPKQRLQPIRSTPPPPFAPALPDFDRAAFLNHMRGLIRQREQREARRELREFEAEVLATQKLSKLAQPQPARPQPQPSAIHSIIQAQREAAQAAAEYRRQQAAHARAALAEFYENERLEWTGCLLSAIVECEGTPYAVLIPQMRADIANIESQPRGALPWRFDRAAFERHFESFKAKVGVPHHV